MIEANLWSYWAHLSIYKFAIPFCAGRHILEAGSGVGYGAAYLAKNGATIHACDASAESVRHSQRTYNEAGLSYSVADLNRPLPMKDEEFDVVFSSNVFEHVTEVDALAAECARVVTRDGVVIVAVPTITTASFAQDDIRNHHHVHHLPPAAWHAKLFRFFAEIRCHGHQAVGHWNSLEVQTAEISRWTNEVTIRETDFEFPEVEIAELNRWQCITSVFVCRQPRSVALAETFAERTPYEWHEATLAARIIAEEKVKREEEKVKRKEEKARHERAYLDKSREIDRLRDEIAMLRGSTAWRVTQPARSLIMTIRKLLNT